MIVSAGRSMAREYLKNWRVYEREACQKYFGEIIDVSCEDGHSVLDAYEKYHPSAVRWYPDPELTTRDEFRDMSDQARSMPDVEHINPVHGFSFVQCKDLAFMQWNEHGISTPRWGDDPAEIAEYPVLVRINDGVSGSGSRLIERAEDLQFPDAPKTGRINTRIIWVEYIDTTWRGYRRSFRIHVSGGNIISGYGRIGNDWCAITKGFKPGMEEDWLECQRDCERIIQRHGNEIVRAVDALGLDMEGVDIIVRKDDESLTPIFLEVQPTYASGYPHVGYANYYPPYWNPSPASHPELVAYIRKNIETLKREIPRYCDLWLDKKNHFDAVYKALREAKNV